MVSISSDSKAFSENKVLSNNAVFAFNAPLINFNIFNEISKARILDEEKRQLLNFSNESAKVMLSYGVVFYININYNRINSILESLVNRIDESLLSLVFPLPNLPYIENDSFFPLIINSVTSNDRCTIELLNKLAVKIKSGNRDSNMLAEFCVNLEILMSDDIWVQSFSKFFRFSYGFLWNQIRVSKVEGKELNVYLDDLTNLEAKKFREYIQACREVSERVNKSVTKIQASLESQKK